MSLLADFFLGVETLALTGILAGQLPRRTRSATPQNTRAAADTTPAALGSTRPALALTEAFACPRCGTRALQKRGTVLKTHGLYQQYRCGNAHWFRVLIGAGDGGVMPLERAS